MSLTQQFIIVSIFPLSFLGMALYVWRSGLVQRELMLRWTGGLLAAAVWGSSVLRFYGGATIPDSVTFTWGVIGKYALSVTAVAILLATFTHLTVSPKVHRFTLSLSGALWVLAFALDYQIWPYDIPNLTLANQTIRHFDLWAAMWIASWLIPLLSAWILTRQIRANSPNSLYRTQSHYWLLTLVLFIVGSGLASIHQLGQPGWQEAGLLVIITAAFVGTVSITHSHLPDLQLALRQLFIRLSGTILIFGLSWLALMAIERSAMNLPANTSPNLILLLAAAFLAGFFTLVYRLVNEITRRLLSPASTKHEEILASFKDMAAHLPEPVQVAQSFLRVIESELRTGDAWVYLTEDGPAGKLMLRPLANLSNFSPEPISLDEDSLFAAYLRQNQTPLVQHDIESLSYFDKMRPEEKEQLTAWRRALYMPLYAGSTLVGLLALGEKSAGESYDRNDFKKLQALAPHVSPLLAQARNLANLQQINAFAFEQNRTLAHEKLHLEEMINLYKQFVKLVSPELKRPFPTITQKIEQLQTNLADDKDNRQTLADLTQQIEQIQIAVERLIVLSGRLQSRETFHFEPADLDTITQQAIHSLQTMAEARRVNVVYEPSAALPPVLGDAAQLQEAVQHLLHNAIKFNKIGGEVTLRCTVIGNEICMQINDTGVGIPKERLETLWQGLALTRNGNGRLPGMGLPLAHYIVAAHGGRVKAESQYGLGSAISIYLPISFDE